MLLRVPLLPLGAGDRGLLEASQSDETCPSGLLSSNFGSLYIITEGVLIFHKLIDYKLHEYKSHLSFLLQVNLAYSCCLRSSNFCCTESLVFEVGN